jgi:hypothetical protein
MTYYRIHACEAGGQQIMCPDAVFELDCGTPFDWPTNQPTRATNKTGELYDWLEGNCWSPLVSTKIRARLEPTLKNSVQWHGPFEVRGHDYYLLNCLNVIDCALPGSNSNKLLIDVAAASQLLLFRPQGFVRDLICSQVFRDDCVSNGDTGIRFGRIKEDGWEDFPF